MITPLLTEKEVAALLKCSPHVVRRLPIPHGYLKPNCKRSARYTMEAVESYLRSVGLGQGSHPVSAPTPMGGTPKRCTRVPQKSSSERHWREIPSVAEERKARRTKKGIIR
jgi:hypothetical protein